MDILKNFIDDFYFFCDISKENLVFISPVFICTCSSDLLH